jgi:hypothetical protein
MIPLALAALALTYDIGIGVEARVVRAPQAACSPLVARSTVLSR